MSARRGIRPLAGKQVGDKTALNASGARVVRASVRAPLEGTCDGRATDDL